MGMQANRYVVRALGAALHSALVAGTGSAIAKDEIVMAVPTFTTGAGGPAFGVPGKQGTELVVDAINAGTVPAPYNTKGMGGARVKALVYDESGGNTKQVAELRNKVQKENVDLVVGYVSSGTCAAVAPVAEELKILTLLTVCGTPRVFEELVKEPKYVFRTMNHAVASNLSLARYVVAKYGEKNGYTGVNPNYAWGQDSWRDFDLSMKVLAPKMIQTTSPQFPKLFGGQFGSEISAMLRAPEQIVHSSVWGGDIESLIFQGSPRGLFDNKLFLFTVGDSAVFRLGKQFPMGSLVGARGPYGIYASTDLNKSPLNVWFQKEYRARFKEQPSQAAYQYVQGVLAAKYAYDRAAAANGGKFPSTDQVITALRGATFTSLAGMVKMSHSKGHQAVTEDMWGVLAWDDKANEPMVKDVVTFAPECVNPPADTLDSTEWIKAGMKGAKC